MLLTETILYIHWSYALWVIIAYVSCLYFYRVYLSPLAKIPGPKLAAATSWYEAYYDFVENGRFPWHIRDLHEKYGPVVRINPREVHIYDPEYVERLYLQRLDKDPAFANSFGIPLAIHTTWNHDLHRQRRSAVNKFFAKTTVVSRIDIIQTQVSKLCDILERSTGTGEIVQIDAGFICLTLDIIAEFCYGVNYDYLSIPGFHKTFKAMIEEAFGAGAMNRHFPFVLTIMSSLPVWLVMRLLPQLSGLIGLQEMVRIQARRVFESRELGGKTAANNNPFATSHDESGAAGVSPTVFDQILDSNIPSSEKTEERLTQEAQSLIGAGSETTSRVLYVSVFHLLQQPLLLARLRQELQGVMSSSSTEHPTLQQLELLPFLTAVIKESIRLGGSTATRGARMSPSSDPLAYKDWVFSPGTPVSVTLHHVMMDETIFPDPDEFNPMRWLLQHKRIDDETGEEREVLGSNPALDRFFVAFSRGPRSCIGMWLAWAELYLTMAHIYHKFDMELYETTVDDIKAACDRLSCFAKPGNRGVRVRIMRRR